MSIGRHPDSAAGYSDAATFVLNKFNKGSFGKFLLEDMGKHKQQIHYQVNSSSDSYSWLRAS